LIRWSPSFSSHELFNLMRDNHPSAKFWIYYVYCPFSVL
jgi:hypothetical protein